ncbi:hypothetical protein ARGLB_083_00850 [Arthrobacter globiformis NBRC 12137]|uniref:LysM domain-containing protein n=1 Tax=Arthrobacter globiformis (strain ATCC 8010 / DSM 20124 / JCM 1332 / NBRC 12137 / NCIMB 8907 / NRRL B-2979 / 168) TaxID=1077972 RepID=H0QQU5_ARTG1|nr:hypothetical protein ARGLB_083_00850 [Arthrobacter globiformis NBRC 12137]
MAVALLHRRSCRRAHLFRQHRSRPHPSRPLPLPRPPVAEVAQAPVQARHAAAIAVSGETYTVQDGDTLSKIADKLGIHGGWQHLADANADTISNPNLVFVGQVLQLPA